MFCVTSNFPGKPPTCVYSGEVEFFLLLAGVDALYTGAFSGGSQPGPAKAESSGVSSANAEKSLLHPRPVLQRRKWSTSLSTSNTSDTWAQTLRLLLWESETLH